MFEETPDLLSQGLADLLQPVPVPATQRFRFQGHIIPRLFTHHPPGLRGLNQNPVDQDITPLFRPGLHPGQFLLPLQSQFPGFHGQIRPDPPQIQQLIQALSRLLSVQHHSPLLAKLRGDERINNPNHQRRQQRANHRHPNPADDKLG